MARKKARTKERLPIPTPSQIERAIQERLIPGPVEVPRDRPEQLERLIAARAIPGPVLGPEGLPPEVSPETVQEAVPRRTIDIQGGIGRALRGFAAGFAATPAGAAQDPVLGGIAGGLAGLGQLSEQRRREALLREFRAGDIGRISAREQALQEVRDPFLAKREKVRQAGRLKRLEREFELLGGPALTERQRAALERERTARRRIPKTLAERIAELRRLQEPTARQPAPTGRATIRTPDGSVVSIPRENLAEAIRRGATEVR